MPAALSISSLTPAVAPPPQRGVKWNDVETAAKRSGLDESSIRRLCGKEWFARGLAKLEGKQWRIREDADVRLSRVRLADDLPADLRGLSDKNRRKLLAKAAILKSWESYLVDAVRRGQTSESATACFLEELASGLLPDAKLPATMKLPTDRTLYRWRGEYRSDGLGGLIDERGTNREKPVDGEDPFFEAVKFHLLDQRERSKHLCWELACKEASMSGWMPRSYKQTLRFIAKIPHRILQRHRKGSRFANGTSEPFISRDYSSLKSNEVWCSDEHTFDVWVKYRGDVVRPYLVGFEDMRSRKIVGWVISAKSADTDTVLAALHRGCSSHGAPEKIYVDNGKVYDNRALSGRTKQMRLGKVEVDEEIMTGVLAGLGIAITHAIAFNAKAKPVERFFGTVCDRFSKLQTTYCGKNPQSRPANLKSKLERNQAPEFDDFVADFEQWLEGDYHAREHHGDSMDGKTPATVFAECLVEKRTAPQQVLDVMLWKPSPPTKCRRHGVTCEGIDYGRGEPALHRMDGKEVLISIDPNDANRAAIREVKTGKFICMATANQKLPFNTPKAQLKETMAVIRKEKKELHRGYAPRPRKSFNAADRIYEDGAARQRAADQAANLPPPQEKIIHTPISDQLDQLKNAMQRTGQPPLKIAGEPSDDVQEPTGIPFSKLMEATMQRLDEEREREELAKAQSEAEHQRLFDQCFGSEVG